MLRSLQGKTNPRRGGGPTHRDDISPRPQGYLEALKPQREIHGCSLAPAARSAAGPRSLAAI